MAASQRIAVSESWKKPRVCSYLGPPEGTILICTLILTPKASFQMSDLHNTKRINFIVLRHYIYDSFLLWKPETNFLKNATNSYYNQIIFFLSFLGAGSFEFATLINMPETEHMFRFFKNL